MLGDGENKKGQPAHKKVALLTPIDICIHTYIRTPKETEENRKRKKEKREREEKVKMK